MGNLNKNAKLQFSYTQMERALDQFVEQINSKGIDYHCVVGIARGGLIPAVRMSHRLGIPMKIITWTTRDGDITTHTDVMQVVTKLRQGHKILLVEDIIDSGRTLTEILSQIDPELKENLHIATMINNVDVGIIPMYTSISISRSSDEAWYEFWWESKTKNEIHYLQACW